MMDYLTEAHDDIQAYFKSHEIPTYFYQCLFGELVKVWGVKFLIPDKYYDAQYDDNDNLIEYADDKYSYKDQLDFYFTCFSGTGGWGVAFNEACDQCDLSWLHQDYRQMDWVRSDIFDEYIVDAMIEMLFAEDANSDYYFFKVRKEKPND